MGLTRNIILAAKIMGLTIVFFGLQFFGLQEALAFSSLKSTGHFVTTTERLASESINSPHNLILIDNEGDDEACDPGEDCSTDAKAAPKHAKKSNKKKKKAGATSNNDDCDPGEDCSGEAD